METIPQLVVHSTSLPAFSNSPWLAQWLSASSVWPRLSSSFFSPQASWAVLCRELVNKGQTYATNSEPIHSRFDGVQGWESLCWRVLGILLLENQQIMVSWFLGVWFLDCKVSWFLGFKVSWSRNFKDSGSHITEYPFHVLKKILIPYSRFSKTKLNGSSWLFGANLFQPFPNCRNPKFWHLQT